MKRKILTCGVFFLRHNMQTNNHKIVGCDLVPDAKLGKECTPERTQAEEAADSFYSGQIPQDGRKEAKVRHIAKEKIDKFIDALKEHSFDTH